MPVISIVSEAFLAHGRAAARAQAVPDLVHVVIPSEVMLGITQDVRPACEAIIGEIVDGLTKQPSTRAASKPREERQIVVGGLDYWDAVENMNELFLSSGWSDGLPLVPPTKEQVEWMLTGTSLPRDMVLTRKLMPRYGAVTVENVAINAAMAGAKPEYMPAILAAVGALATERGLHLTEFITNSGTPVTPVLIVNGPIAKELNINGASGVMHPGWRANATIGRALRLVLTNGAGAHPNPGGVVKTQSTPGSYTWCLAENEAESPWEPLHVELGFDPGDSTVTVMAARGSHMIYMREPKEALLGSIAHAVRGMTQRRFAVPWDQLLILNPSHAQLMGDAGWSKTDVKRFVYEKARLSMGEVEAAGMVRGEAQDRESPTADKTIMVPMTERAEDMVIIVAGGRGGSPSTLVPCMLRKVTAEIAKYR